MNQNQKKQLVNHLFEFVVDNRRKRFEEVIQNRTRHLTVVLENIYQPQNASAVLRSCDCFGIQDVHIIENYNKYSVNPDIALGSANWLSLTKYGGTANNTLSCIGKLKEQGYKIIATSPHKNDFDIHDLNIDHKTALVFGTEETGITDDVINAADGFVKIPMFGFTESFNISVSVGLCLHTLVHKLHASNINWQLSEEEKQDVLLDWLRTSIYSSKLIEEEFLRKK